MAIPHLIRYARGAAAAAAFLLIALPVSGPLRAQDEALTEEEELAEALLDPVASLISVPVQNTVDFGIGDADASRYTLNLVPNVALRVLPTWDLISRTNLPIVAQQAAVPGGDGVSGIGDIRQTFLASPPADERALDFGVGLVLLLPTATEDDLGRDRWAIGPSAAIDYQEDHVTVGVQGNHQWSFAGNGAADINTTTVGPFVARTFPSGTVLNVSLDPSYDWEGEQWTVPLFVGASQLFELGARPVNVGGGIRVFLEGPDGGPDWGLRLSLTALFPQ